MNTIQIRSHFAATNTAQADTWIRIAGHIGIAARGVVYLVIGYLALQYAFTSGGELTSAKGALRNIGQATYGQVLLTIIGVGLLCYAIFRCLGAWKDIDDKGSDGSGIAGRVVFALGGIVYGALGASVLGLTFSGSGGGGSTRKSYPPELERS